MASVYSVKQVNSYIKNMFTQDFMLTHIFVKGEVSNCKYHSTGHIYFTIKDESGTIACVMFASDRKKLSFILQEGQTIVVEGSIRIYERDGKYQLYAKSIEQAGMGILYQRFEQLKETLEEMGMFSEQYKRPIPSFVQTVGIVTSKTGAAIQDIINISFRRNPYVQLVLYPALVQGEGAKESIVQGIRSLDALGLDVLIVGRGGGSIEDLWAFNEECVARAIFECQTPVISAVGHEVDVTIADYVADLRAPTPSAAAELAVFDCRAFFNRLSEMQNLLERKMQMKLDRYHFLTEQYRLQVRYFNPQNQILEKKQHLLDFEEKLEDMIGRKITEKQHQLSLYAEQLESFSPLRKLNKGYAYVCDKEKKPFQRITQAKEGETLSIQIADGMVQAEIKEVKIRTLDFYRGG